MQSTEFNARFIAIGVSANVFAALAQCQESELSRYRRGFRVGPTRVERMDAVLVELEDLVTVDPEVRPDVSTVERVRAAQKRLAAIRAEQSAKNDEVVTVPWRFKGAVAMPEDNAAASSACQILSDDRRGAIGTE